MSVRGNSGFNDDRRFGTKLSDVTGMVSREQQYLERLNGRSVGRLIPTDVTLWLKSDEGVSLISDRVPQWDDISFNGNNINAVQSSSSKRPNYTLSDSNFNNYPSLNFNGYSYNMETNINNPFLDCSDGFTVYIVTKIIDAPSTYSFLLTRTNGTSWTKGWGILKYYGSWRFWVNNWNSDSKRVDLTFNNTSDVHIIKMRYDKINITAEIIGTINTNGIQPYTDSVINPSSSDGLNINCGGSSSYYLKSDNSEIMFYNRPLDNNEQIKTEEYLKNKYNI
jgi:hypothetical protein